MAHKKAKKESGNAARAGVTKEMAQPRMARSARIASLGLDAERIPEQPSTSMPGTVEKIIPSQHPNTPGDAQIAVERSDHVDQDIRIENTLIDEHGDDVKLEKGARVELTVTSHPKPKPSK